MPITTIDARPSRTPRKTHPMTPRLGVVLLPLFVAGCGLPPAVTIASFAIDALSLAVSEKTVTDHALSQIPQKDCAMWRGFTGDELCIDEDSTVEVDLQTALVERNRALFEGNRMRRHINNLETRLGELQEAELESVQRLTDRAVAYIESMEKVVRLTGLTADRLLEADTGLPRGQGGPFIEAEPDALPADRLKANLTTLDARLQHSKALEAVMRKLPLTAPLNSFYITSSFGKRRDPINRKWAAHYGLDMGGALRSPVYVTVPGVVTFVGWKGKYGKVIEVDHGAGIKTRYGHLHKTLVKKGQKVKYRQKIGVLGNTGRSTGAHLHYEVLFKRKAKDPMKFIRAGRYVFHG